MTNPTPKPAEPADKKENKLMEYVPFGAKDPIKLSCSIVRSLIAQPTKTGKLPTDQDCMRFLMMCQARRLNPFEGDSFMLGYDTQNGPKFSLITAHQAFLKRAELNAQYDGMKSGIIVKRGEEQIDLEGDFHNEDDTVLGGWATVFFKDRANPMQKRVRLKRFKKNTQIWTDDPAGMICKCAEADALRSSFPTMLGGLYLKEELESESAEARVSKPIFTVPELPEAVAVPPEASIVTPISELRALCAKDGIDENILVERLNEIGLIQSDNLEHVEDKELQIVINSWDSLAAKIKEEEV